MASSFQSSKLTKRKGFHGNLKVSGARNSIDVRFSFGLYCFVSSASLNHEILAVTWERFLVMCIQNKVNKMMMMMMFAEKASCVSDYLYI